MPVPFVFLRKKTRITNLQLSCLPNIHKLKIRIFQQIINFLGFCVCRHKSENLRVGTCLCKHLRVVGNDDARLNHRSALLLHVNNSAHKLRSHLRVPINEWHVLQISKRTAFAIVIPSIREPIGRHPELPSKQGLTNRSGSPYSRRRRTNFCEMPPSVKTTFPPEAAPTHPRPFLLQWLASPFPSQRRQSLYYTCTSFQQIDFRLQR